MAEDELDLSEFEEFSKTAASSRRSGKGGGGKGTGSGKRRRRWPWFVVGLVLGAAAALVGPDLADPYLPEVLQVSRTEVRGPVLGKRIDGDRLLLTVDTERGAVLATFRQRVPEIDLLVQEGDTVTLGLDAFAPLVEGPALEGVTKGRPGATGAPGDSVVPAPEGQEDGISDGGPAPDSARGAGSADTLDPGAA